MLSSSESESNSKDLPKVLVLKSPPVLTMFEDRFSEKFHIVKASDSPLSLDQFLASHIAQSAKAILCCSAEAPRISSDIIRQLPLLRLVVTTSAGANHIDVAECRRRGIDIASAGDVFSDDVADMAVGLLIDVLRKISAGDRYVRRGNWAILGDFHLGSKLRGKRVGIVGLGRIGREVAKRLEVFGCKFSYNSRKKKDFVSYPFYANLRDLAADSDALVVCCGLTDQTRHMIDKTVLLALGKEGVIVNVGRGAIVNEKEMVECLVKGEIGGAGLDVFECEPNVPQELSGLENVVLSPHCAVYTAETLSVCASLLLGIWKLFSRICLCSLSLLGMNEV